MVACLENNNVLLKTLIRIVLVDHFHSLTDIVKPLAISQCTSLHDTKIFMIFARMDN